MHAERPDPAEVWTSAGGEQVHPLRAGDAGRPLVLMHGGALDCAAFLGGTPSPRWPSTIGGERRAEPHYDANPVIDLVSFSPRPAGPTLR